MPSSRSRGSGRGPDSTQNPKVPKSERQQLAIVMQISSQDVPPPAPVTIEERKKTRQQRNERGETPLHTACIKGDAEQVQRLLNQGLDPNQPDFAGWTPLHEACSYGNYPIVELLVRRGVSVNVKGLDDDTPLHDAVTTGNLRMIQLLVEHGAEPFVKNAHGFTPAEFTVDPIIIQYFEMLKDSNSRATHVGRPRDDIKKGNVSSEGSKRARMDGIAHGVTADGKDDKRNNDKDDNQVSSGVVSSTQDDGPSSRKRSADERKRSADDDDDDEGSKRRKRKEAEDRELMGKPAPVHRTGVGRVLTGSKPPGPASKTGAAPLGKGGGQNKGKSLASGKGTGKVNAQSTTQGKSGKGSQAGKLDRKSPVASPKSSRDADDDDYKPLEAPKVPPLKIVIPGGAGGSGGRNDQEGEGGSGTRGSGKGRGSASTLPYVIPSTSADASPDASDERDDKRAADSTKASKRILRSHKNVARRRHSYKSPPSWGSGDDHHGPSSSHRDAGTKEVHPRKRKLKGSRESHSRDHSKASEAADSSQALHNITHSNPYQMYIHIRKQIDRRQKGLFPVKPKPPKDFNKYLMNRCTYTLQANTTEPQVELPIGLPPQMAAEFTEQEKERTRLRVQHLVEKEKLVLAVEQEILRVHGRAERAVANQALPFSVCTMLRDREVYNILAPEQEEKRNAQRSRCNGRQINSWLQEVDDKWEKIKEGMLRRQHTEAETLHAVQIMGWEWKLKENALCDYKTTPKIDTTHVPQIHVSNFDLPA